MSLIHYIVCPFLSTIGLQQGVRVFENVVVIAFQSIFYSEMHKNNIFFIFKKLFLISIY
jgi:hypothetical protein